MKEYLTISKGQGAVAVSEIPWLEYEDFCTVVGDFSMDHSIHCINYFAIPSGKLSMVSESRGFLLVCLLADDKSGVIHVIGSKTEDRPIPSLTHVFPALYIFEREIHENAGIKFLDHPWQKPVRFPHNRADQSKGMDDYPFYRIEGDELHEVGVGPVHAGVIEPGHFRFLCNGERVLHLEIQLGYQHRGVETLMTQTDSRLRMALLAESVAGDTAAGHSTAHAQLMEALTSVEVSDDLALERLIAQELERVAVHIGDTAALCADVAYQLGQVVNESLRTMVINTSQLWCGNRFSKGLIRPGGTRYPLTRELAGIIRENLGKVKERFVVMSDRLFSMPSVLGRFEGIGVVTTAQTQTVGAVGMAARMAGVSRDVRASHPDTAYQQVNYTPIVLESGDVLARAMVRRLEVLRSMELIEEALGRLSFEPRTKEIPDYQSPFLPDTLAVSLTEGWRGEICHTALTNAEGKLVVYKIKDPSLHNWMSLALAVRNQEISDFPVCNKSFNLSYCGNDL